MVDGGLVDPIPAEEAYRRGARRMLVIRSRPSAVVKKNSALTRPVAAMMFRTPALARASLLTAQRYQQAVAFVHSPPSDAKVVELAPSTPLQTRRTTQNVTHLRADYTLGRQLAHRSREQLRSLLS